MKTKITISLAVGLLLGFLVRHFWPTEPDVARHWRAVREYNSFIRNPSNHRPDETTGFSVVTPPFSPEPHLAALVEAGELEHLDIVLPTVPRSKEATKHWMAFCERHSEDIVYASGNPTRVAFKPQGSQPTHLNIWYRKSAEERIQQLIRELEAMTTEGPTTTTTLLPERAPTGKR